jgi:dihydroorotase (homodimeric type)
LSPKSEQRLVIRRPDDWHVHLRDGEMLAAVVGHTARQFGRAIVMPNLSPPITTIQQAQSYRSRILSALPANLSFEPLLTAYLTDTISAAEIATGYGEDVFAACKLYPAHATTNADHGVTSIALIKDVLETLQRIDMPLLIHGEVTSPQVDVFDREAVFIETVLQPLRCWGKVLIWRPPLRRIISRSIATRCSKVAYDRICTACQPLNENNTGLPCALRRPPGIRSFSWALIRRRTP